MTTFIAILKDAYYQLNSKKLFWVTLALSGLVVLVYASIGFNEEGMFLFFGLSNIESPMFSSESPLSSILYRSIFSTFILSIWLTWIAAILALVSTTSIFPDFLADGSVDLVLSKPVGRLQLFFYKYITSLLFVIAQVAFFCVGVFICIGWRVGEWNWMIFAAIPIVVLFYSYLYSFNVLVGVTSRSALAALLLTMLLWVSIWSVNTAEALLNTFRIQIEVNYERAVEADPDTPNTLEEDSFKRLVFWHDKIVKPIKFVMPKTAETVGLMDRWLSRDDDISFGDMLNGNVNFDEATNEASVDERNNEEEAQARLREEYEGRSITYIIGTSLVFEAIILMLAAGIFSRRDY